MLLSYSTESEVFADIVARLGTLQGDPRERAALRVRGSLGIPHQPRAILDSSRVPGKTQRFADSLRSTKQEVHTLLSGFLARATWWHREQEQGKRRRASHLHGAKAISTAPNNTEAEKLTSSFFRTPPALPIASQPPSAWL